MSKTEPLSARHVIVQANGSDSLVGKPVISEHADEETARTEANALQEKTEAHSYCVLQLVGQTKPVRSSKFFKVR